MRYRAIITLDPVRPRPGERPGRRMPLQHPRSVAQLGPGAQLRALAVAASATPEYRDHTHELMVRAECLTRPGVYRNFAAEICWDDELPLHPGDRHKVTITLTDDDAPRFLRAGQHFTLWRGADVGHGTVSRQVFSEYGPC